MKSMMKILIMVVTIIVIGVVTKKTVLANAAEVNKTQENVTRADNATETNDEGTSYVEGSNIFYIEFEKLSYNVYCKGHNVPHTLVYTVNGGEKVTDILLSDGKQVFCGIPKYIVYYYEFPNVKEGDVIEYEYSYTYTYGGFPEERVTPGRVVVE